MRIGLADNGYPEKRCITGNKDNDFSNYSNKNLFKYLNFLKGKIFKSPPEFAFKPYAANTIKNADAFHFFNHVGLIEQKWISTFETIIPRIPETMDIHRQPDGKNSYDENKRVKTLLTNISKDNCIGILALSQSAYDIQMGMLKAYPELLEKIQKKMQVVHPPQKLLSAERNIKDIENGPVKFIFVGSDFYRKGGAELVLAFSGLLDDGDISATDVAVTLIGDLSKRNNYVHGNFQDDTSFHEYIERQIKKFPCVTHFTSLPNTKVLDSISTSHVGLLPTWGDTYGYSVLEMQSYGCPVITTNVRALTEINSTEAGWVITAPINKFREIVITSESDKQQIRRNIVDGLKKAIKNVVNDRQSICAKSLVSIERIKKEHDPEIYFSKINALYRSK